MSTDSILRIDPKTVTIHALNRTPRPGHVKELSLSIKSEGQTTPILVRPHPEKIGHYEVAAGACRKLACESLGIEVQAIVRDLDNQTFEEILLIENLQREGLDPFEEAEKLAVVMASGGSVKNFAAKLGKTSAWLKSRLRLSNIDPDVRKEVQGYWPLDAIEALADFPHATQAAILDYCNSVPDAKYVRDVGTRQGVNIETVNWFGNEDSVEDICGTGGCSSTNKDMLFKEKNDCTRCMNPDCFKGRLARHAASFIAKLTEEIGQANVMVRNKVCNLINNKLGSAPAVERYNDYQSKSDLGRKVDEWKEGCRGLVELTEDNNIEVWFYKPKTEAKDGKKSAASAAPEANRPDRTAMLKGKRFMALLTQVTDSLKAFAIPLSHDLVAAFGTECNYDRGNSGDRWKMMAENKFTHSGYAGPSDNKALVKVNATDYVTEQIRLKMLSRLSTNLNPSRAAEDKNLVDELMHVATFTGFDVPAACLKIAADFPPAKSWADEVDPLTLKPKKVKDAPAAESIKGRKPKKTKADA